MKALCSAPGEDPVVLSVLLPASVSRAYEAWTDPLDIVQWFGAPPDRASSAEMDLRKGGTWRIRFEEGASEAGWLEGEYLEIDPDERLVFTWTHVVQPVNEQRVSSPVSQVTITFREENAETRLSLRHEAISSESARRNVGAGWVATLERLLGGLK